MPLWMDSDLLFGILVAICVSVGFLAGRMLGVLRAAELIYLDGLEKEDEGGSDERI